MKTESELYKNDNVILIFIHFHLEGEREAFGFGLD
jgi:hypothetical protein